MVTLLVLTKDDFNSRPRERGFPVHFYGNAAEYTFQFTPPREGLQDQPGFTGWKIEFQFTPPREGLQLSDGAIFVDLQISIHAPARGASIDLSKHSVEDLFQFTPPREGLRTKRTR